MFPPILPPPPLPLLPSKVLKSVLTEPLVLILWGSENINQPMSPQSHFYDGKAPPTKAPPAEAPPLKFYLLELHCLELHPLKLIQLKPHLVNLHPLKLRPKKLSPLKLLPLKLLQLKWWWTLYVMQASVSRGQYVDSVSTLFFSALLWFHFLIFSSFLFWPRILLFSFFLYWFSSSLVLFKQFLPESEFKFLFLCLQFTTKYK